jgi:hypothetical protein
MASLSVFPFSTEQSEDPDSSYPLNLFRLLVALIINKPMLMRGRW